MTGDYSNLSKRYREGGSGFQSQEERTAYIQARMPATFAAVSFVLKELEGLDIQSLADWGAGPGTGFLAARDLFPSLNKAYLIERDAAIIALGKKLIGDGPEWLNRDATIADAPQVDLTLFSYSLGEIEESKRPALLLKAWANCKWLAVIEPGTPKGYQNILSARELLLEHVIAPCPHHKPCPMIGHGWCHFSARLARTKEHRQLKGGSLGYEDEKFSYVIFGKEPILKYPARIVGHPQKLKGNVKLTLCTDEGTLKEQVVSKRQGALYKWARKAEWGDRYV